MTNYGPGIVQATAKLAGFVRVLTWWLRGLLPRLCMARFHYPDRFRQGDLFVNKRRGVGPWRDPTQLESERKTSASVECLSARRVVGREVGDSPRNDWNVIRHEKT
jgi:hypothetical protein